MDSRISAMLDRAYNGSYYTIVGCDGDLDEWKDGYSKMLESNGIGTPQEFISFFGTHMNEKYGLTGTNRYPDDIVFLAFPLVGLRVPKLAMFKIRMQDRWFDDIVDNNAMREGHKL